MTAAHLRCRERTWSTHQRDPGLPAPRSCAAEAPRQGNECCSSACRLKAEISALRKSQLAPASSAPLRLLKRASSERPSARARRLSSWVTVAVGSVCTSGGQEALSTPTDVQCRLVPGASALCGCGASRVCITPSAPLCLRCNIRASRSCVAASSERNASFCASACAQAASEAASAPSSSASAERPSPSRRDIHPLWLRSKHPLTIFNARAGDCCSAGVVLVVRWSSLFESGE